MDLDATVCFCFHVSKRKVVHFLRRERPARVSQISSCLSAGTGCGWCIRYLEQLHREIVVEGRSGFATDVAAEAHAAGRQAYLAAGRRRVEEEGTASPLKALHPDASLVQLKLEKLRKMSTDQLLESLRPGTPGALKARPDGTMLDGHHRIAILRERCVHVESLPREVVEKDPSPGS